MRSGADLRGGTPLVSFNHVIDMIRILSLSPAVCIQQSATLTRTLTQTLILTVTSTAPILTLTVTLRQWSLIRRCRHYFSSHLYRFFQDVSCLITSLTDVLGECRWRQTNVKLDSLIFWSRAWRVTITVHRGAKVQHTPRILIGNHIQDT